MHEPYALEPEEMQVDTPERLVSTVRKIKPGARDYRLHDVEVRIDDSGLATVWVRYDFFIDGERSHCGRVLFHLYRLAGKWRVANFADTHGSENCGSG